MKIGVVALVGPQNGGVYNYSISFLNLVQKLNNSEVVLITTKNFSKFYDYPNKLILPDYVNYRFIRLLRLLFIKIKIDVTFINYNYKFRDFDYIHSTITSLFPLHYLSSSIKKSFTLHDLQEIDYPNNFTKKERYTRNLVAKELCNKNYKILCESNFVLTQISKNFKTENIIVIPLPPSLQDCISKEHKNLINKKFFFYPANLWPHKNHKNLIFAIKKILDHNPEIYLVLSGNITEEFNNINNLVKELNIQNNVMHLGFVLEQEKRWLYENCLALVMPSFYESISIPVYEAYYYDCTVISSNLESMKEQIKDSVILINPEDINSIYNAMFKVVEGKYDNAGLKKLQKIRLSEVSESNCLEKLNTYFK